MVTQTFQDFLSKVFNSDAKKANELAHIIAKEIKPLAEELKIGKLSIAIKQPATFCDVEHNVEKDVLYEKLMCVGDRSYTNQYEAKYCGRMTFVAHVLKKQVWTDSEISALEFLFQILFTVLSKARLNQLIIKSEHTDAVTGVYNTLGLEHLGEMIATKKFMKKFSVVFFNICGFRKINERLDSKNGDVFLRTLATDFNKFLGKDGAIARLGGDNFAIIVKTSRISDIIKYLTNLRVIVEVNGENKIFDVNVKAGVCNCENAPQGLPFKAYLGSASVAYKVAKLSQVENIVFYTPDMQKKI